MVKVKEEKRYTAKSNTVSDKKTGLKWIQDHCAIKSFIPELNDMDSAAAIAELNRIKYAGHNDWREPTREELQSIVDYNRHNPAIDPIFKNTKPGWYRTSSPVAGYSSSVWCVFFNYGSVGFVLKGGKFYVRPVRSSQ
jgi:hypothetical protein